MPNVSIADFRDFSNRIFQAVGATPDDASIITESLLFASLRGHDSHGAGHMPLYIQNYLGRGFSINKEYKPRIINETPATIAVDADFGLGQKVCMDVTEKVIEKAKTMGIAAGTVGKNTHNGALAYYIDRIVSNDMIGLAFTGSGACAPPWGGVERMLGTNPIGIGVPAGQEYPIIIDMATSSATWMGLLPKLMHGDPIPEGTLLDDDGNPTTDPAKFTTPAQRGETRGAMNNMAGNHKGYAIQLAVEMLGGIFPGMLNGNEATGGGRLTTPMFIIAINVSFFQDLQAFKDKVDSRIREIKNSKKRKGVDEILIPGERGFKLQEKRLRDGIPIPDAYWKQIQDLAAELNVAMPELAAA
ncbi:MAG TPA: Ldh family oxidoreductase [Dehalococcoidia bacterium]|nr:Ldh family oxidoreductase [Dehalococcoidia bacterium]